MSQQTLQGRRTGPRLTGMSFVLLLHLLIVWALASGLAHRAVRLIHAPIEARLIREQAAPAPAPPQAPKAAAPALLAPQPLRVPPPEIETSAAPSPQAATISTGALSDSASIGVSAADVCTRMGKPLLPQMGWEGEALFRANARVQDGRVVAASVLRLRGELSRRHQALLIGAIQAALRDSYECPGASEFQQEFLFKIH